ncbi:hypothetical protein ACOWPK_19745 [Pseudomonas aeruginosa]|uniref:hypothetical protein n=1 Tax=Pseudomonas aeruginosa TaxID=287 RepID=UPI0005BDEC68|nr:hypothetical protein [Pseudomonas aeruginosa]MBX6029595.1 hypothetical protein [Pseudomonas aeruginosa]MCO3570007.1 hypothetical protein [Pseudomonas aeruginosa]HEP8042910.1 hypothetical protein [Pseudomonas aeruginosa]
MFRKILDTVSLAADRVAESVSDAFDTTRETVSSAADAVTDAYGTARDTVVDAADKVADVVSDAYVAACDTVAEAADKASDVASDAYDFTRDTVSSAADSMVDAVSSAYDSTRDVLSDGFDASRGYASNFGKSMGEFWASRKSREEAKEREAEARGEAREKARSVEREQRFEAALKKASARLQDDNAYFGILIAMQAVAQASAACDGGVSADEQEQIDELLLGMGAKWLPQQVRSKLDEFVINPPSLQDAFAMAQKVGPDAQDLFQEIILFVAHLDERVSEPEQRFFAHWVQMRASA